MVIIDYFVFLLGGLVGGALVWHFKTWFQSFWRSSSAIAADLEAKAAALKAAVK
jgi:hypothetical protein